LRYRRWRRHRHRRAERSLIRNGKRLGRFRLSKSWRRRLGGLRTRLWFWGCNWLGLRCRHRFRYYVPNRFRLRFWKQSWLFRFGRQRLRHFHIRFLSLLLRLRPGQFLWRRQICCRIAFTVGRATSFWRCPTQARCQLSGGIFQLPIFFVRFLSGGRTCRLYNWFCVLSALMTCNRGRIRT